MFPAAGLGIPLLLNFKENRFIIHQKMKVPIVSLYSYEFEPHQEEIDGDDNKINFTINENEEKEDSEVVQRKKMKTSPIIIDSSDSKIS